MSTVQCSKRIEHGVDRDASLGTSSQHDGSVLYSSDTWPGRCDSYIISDVAGWSVLVSSDCEVAVSHVEP